MPTTSEPPAELDRLHQLRSGVRLTLALGVAASVAANVLHAQPTLVGRAIAAWPPLALLLTIELISRVPVGGRALATIRLLATAGIAGIAAWVSYWHMVSVATRYGEQTTSAHLIPLSVDGLVVVASVSLVEIAARVRTATSVEPPTERAGPTPIRVPRTRPVTTGTGAAVLRLRRQHPAWTVGQIAERAGVSERTARRHLNAPDTTQDTDTADAA